MTKGPQGIPGKVGFIDRSAKDVPPGKVLVRVHKTRPSADPEFEDGFVIEDDYEVEFIDDPEPRH